VPGQPSPGEQSAAPAQQLGPDIRAVLGSLTRHVAKLESDNDRLRRDNDRLRAQVKRLRDQMQAISGQIARQVGELLASTGDQYTADDIQRKQHHSASPAPTPCKSVIVMTVLTLAATSRARFARRTRSVSADP